jgi:hypothetical protein
MGIIYGSAVLTETDRDGVIDSSIGTLTGEYESLSGDRRLMDEPLSLECIYNTVECCEIHSGFSLFPDELSTKIRKSDTTPLREELHKSFARFCDARFRHKRENG